MKEQKHIPVTDSIAELAQFWDTHDLTDFENELEEVTEPVFQRRPEEVVEIVLRLEEIEKLKRIARSLGTSQMDLVRGWILERIHTL